MYLKNYVSCIALTLCFMGCVGGGCEVDFVFFNLSPNEIWVTQVVGLPGDASPGRLPPVPDEGRLSVKGTSYLKPVRVADKIKIVWDDGGKAGWPGGNYTNKGTLHEMTWMRKELGIPPVMNGGKVCFTYLGNEKWRVRLE